MAEQSRRFVSLDTFIEDQENKNTLSKTRRDVSLLTEFLNSKNESRRIEEIPPKELNEYISEFIVAVRRKDGEDFEPSSLRRLICSFNRHLKACKYPCSVIEDSQFEQARQALEARSKELKKDGKGNKPKAAEAITDEEVNILYNKQLLGISNAEALLNTTWFMNTKHFGLSGCDEHRRMKWGDVQLLTDVNGAEYLEYSERPTKTRTGAEPRNVRAVKPKAYSFANGSPDRDPVFVYKVYCEKRPSSMTDSDSPFYLGINHTKNPTEKPWFKASAMGVNKLNSLMKTMADKAGFDEKRRLTNHSARKTMIQKLNDNNIPQTHIMQLSGHRNVQSVNNYSTVSNEQQKNMSLILSGNTTSTSVEKRPVSSSRSGVATECCESSFMKSSSFPAAGPFSGAVFHGGQFNITINTVNKSPTSTDHSTESTRSFKRIKRVFESSDEDSSTQ